MSSAIAYWISVRVLLQHHERDSVLAQAIGRDFKGNISLVFYLVAIPIAFVYIWLACALCVGVAFIWLVPDKRIESKLSQENYSENASNSN